MEVVSDKFKFAEAKGVQKNNRKIALIAILLFTIILIFIVGIAFTVLAVKTNRIKDDYSVAINIRHRFLLMV